MRVTSLLILSSLFLAQANPVFRRQDDPAPQLPSNVKVVSVHPKDETAPAGTDGDDPAIWIHPKDKAQSVIITTSKEEGVDDGLFVFDLYGRKLQYVPGGKPDNVDVIYGFGKQKIDLTVAACRTDNTICLHKINSDTGLLEEMAGGRQPTKDGFVVYGSCEYKSPKTGKQYSNLHKLQNLRILQYELHQSPSGQLTTTLVRSFFAGKGGQVEGCVVDNDNSYLYLGEEDYGLWRYPAEPTSYIKPYLIDSVNPTAGGKLVPDVEGVSLFYGKKKDEGYLIVSVQGVSAYNVYERKHPHKYVFTFEIKGRKDGSIDEVTETDGLAVVSSALPGYPGGLLVVHDDHKTFKNATEAEHTTFKMVSWADVVKASGKKLKVNPGWDPRRR
ncbi:hypothetical protein HDV00_002296 [Rhizophlyctis rosea]|nr:hypothetical protein HDV00_002296 [Rhizophlyctis rosea]